MNTITINVRKYYSVETYFPYMPMSIFNALEAAFIAGEKETIVLKSDFKIMISEYAKAQNPQNSNSNRRRS